MEDLIDGNETVRIKLGKFSDSYTIVVLDMSEEIVSRTRPDVRKTEAAAQVLPPRRVRENNNSSKGANSSLK